MAIKLVILVLGVTILSYYLFFIIRREKAFPKNIEPTQDYSNSKTQPQQIGSEKQDLSTNLPLTSNQKEFASFIEKRKLEIFREILRRDHIAKQKRQINKATCLHEILEELIGYQGAAEIFDYYGSVELFSETYQKNLGHIPEEIILKCFEGDRQWKTKVAVYEKIKQALTGGSIKTIELPTLSDIWILSVIPKSFTQWRHDSQEELNPLLKILSRNLPSSN